MSTGENLRRADNDSLVPEPSSRIERREAPRYALRRAIWFRRRGAIPASGQLLNISERGALTQVDKREDSDVIPWPLHLRHGDEVWLYNVVKDPLHCWVVAVERDLVRLRIYNDEDVLPDLRALIANLVVSPGGPSGRPMTI